MVTIATDIGLALRAHRRAVGLSQRAFAQVNDLSAGQIARCESRPDSCPLELIVRTLLPTAWTLTLDRVPVASTVVVSTWFAAARAAGGWSVRQAATEWGVSKSAVQRLVTHPGALKLGLVEAAAGPALGLVDKETLAPPAWTAGERDATVAGRLRRYAGHRHVIAPVPGELAWRQGRLQEATWHSFGTADEMAEYLRHRHLSEQRKREWEARMAALPPLPEPDWSHLDDPRNWDDFDDWDEEECGVDRFPGTEAEV